MGLMQDMLTSQPLGLYALAYSVVGMFVISTQEYVYRGHPLTHFSMTLAGGCVTGAILFLHGWVRGPWVSPVVLLTSAVYTAVIAVVVLGALQAVRGAFGFQPSRRRARV
jgi:cell shape-determining protein MreD